MLGLLYLLQGLPYLIQGLPIRMQGLPPTSYRNNLQYSEFTLKSAGIIGRVTDFAPWIAEIIRRIYRFYRFMYEKNLYIYRKIQFRLLKMIRTLTTENLCKLGLLVSQTSIVITVTVIFRKLNSRIFLWAFRMTLNTGHNCRWNGLIWQLVSCHRAM